MHKSLKLDDPATPLVNYHKRREALENWHIDEDTRAALTGRLHYAPGTQRPDFGDCQRQIASIYVWVQLTSGEHNFAPRPIDAAQHPELQMHWKRRQRNAIWTRMHSSPQAPAIPASELNSAPSQSRSAGLPTRHGQTKAEKHDNRQLPMRPSHRRRPEDGQAPVLSFPRHSRRKCLGLRGSVHDLAR